MHLQFKIHIMFYIIKSNQSNTMSLKKFKITVNQLIFLKNEFDKFSALNFRPNIFLRFYKKSFWKIIGKMFK